MKFSTSFGGIFFVTVLFSWPLFDVLPAAPKKYLTESGVDLECLHNRMVIFPGYYAHEVTPIKWIDKVDEFGWGRFTITHFKWLKE